MCCGLSTHSEFVFIDRIGMDDFLATVGAMKDQYLIEEFLKIKRKMQEGGD